MHIERRGQAMVEMAIGMFLIALVVSSLTVFVKYITRTLEMQNHARGASRGETDKIELNAFEREHVFGVKSLKIDIHR